MTAGNSTAVIMAGIDPSLVIGVPAIDQEHYELFKQFDALYGDIEAHPRSVTFSEIFSRMGQQISAHFDNEEKVFKSFEMPADDALSHVQAHTSILEQYVRLSLDLSASKALARSDFLAMFKQWVIDHVVTPDLRIRDFLPTRGMTDELIKDS